MRNIYFISIIALTITSCQQNGITTDTTQKIIPMDVTSEIQKANDKFTAAYKAGDAKKVATETFSANAVVYPPGSPAVTGGAEVLEGFWQAVMDSGIARADIKTDKATQYGDIAIDVGTVKLYDADENILDEANYLVEWTKESIGWRITKDIWNSNKG